MNTLEMKICPNCNLPYEIKSLSPVLQGTIPLFLKCGHSMCKNCVEKCVNNGEPTVNISCKICQTPMEVMASELNRSNLTNFYETFPINTFTLGELLLQLYNTDKNHIEQKDCFINLEKIIQSSEILKRECSKCQASTKNMCKACNKAMCDTCYEKEHRVLYFSLHKLQPIDDLYENICKVHDMKQLEYYCTKCEKATCVDCIIIGGSKSCRNHDIISITEKNESLLGELNETVPKVNEVYKRLTKTAVDVGHLLQNLECDFGSAAEYAKLMGDVEQHFSKLYFSLNKHKKEIKDIINHNKNSELESLNTIKSDIATSIKKATEIINSIEVVNKANDKNKGNVAALLEDAKLIVNTPWYLKKNRGESPKVEVNYDLNTSIANYLHLEGDLQTYYKLSTTNDIGERDAIPPPPHTPVFPPKLTKNVATYTMKTIHDVCSPSFAFCDENLNNLFKSSLSSLKAKCDKKSGDRFNFNVATYTMKTIHDVCSPSFAFCDENLNNLFKSSLSSLKAKCDKKSGFRFNFNFSSGSNATTKTVATTGTTGGLFGSGSNTTTKTVATTGTTGGLFGSSSTGAQEKAKPTFVSAFSPPFGTAFSASTSGLGDGSNNTVSKPFGENNTSTNILGSKNTSGGFIGFNNPSKVLFSSNNTSRDVFGSNNTNGGQFGSNNTSGILFENEQNTITGAQEKAKPTFVSAFSPPFGTGRFSASTSGLGDGSNNTVSKPCGENNTSTNILGSKNTSGGFIGFNNPSGVIFSSNNTSRDVFGSNNTNGGQFGSNNTSGILFENKQNTITGIGFDCTTTRTTQGPFSSTSTSTRVFGQQTDTNTKGTAHVKFDPVVGLEDMPFAFANNPRVKFLTITTMNDTIATLLLKLQL